MSRTLRFAIGTDDCGHCTLLAEALANKKASGFPLEYEVANIARHDWLSIIAPFDVVLWHPSWMQPIASSRFRERIYFMEKYLGKVIVPNFNSVWHFESKVAQSYLFEAYGVRTPRTIASFDYDDAMQQLNLADFPIVQKLPHGSGSRNVRLIKSQAEAKRMVCADFCNNLWEAAKKQYGSYWRALFGSIRKEWFVYKLLHRIMGKERIGAVYWQEYVPGNTRDLRITAIGDRYAYGFWRHNRPHDFRASGSGLINYQDPIPEEPLRYCLELNRRFGFDTMAYDILFTGNSFVITEMSFGYDARAIYNTPGHYELSVDGTVEYKEGHKWAQTLWVEWALHRASVQRA